MNSGRRIAAAVLTAALSMGTIGFTVGTAEADTTWPSRHADTSLTDTTWPAGS